MTPVSRYRHSATSNFRASATAITLRMRPLPSPTRPKNQRLSALSGAHRKIQSSDPPATAFDHDSTLVVAMELSGKSWQLGAVIPGVSRRPKTGVKARDMNEVMRVVDRWEGGGGQGWQDDRAHSCGLR